MEECYEIKPGESIGPFRLGMTRKEIEGLNILPMETFEDGSGTIFRSVGVSVFYDESGKCEKIEARVWGGFLLPGEHVVKCVLAGRIVNDLSDRDACELFKSISPGIKYGYASFELPSVGLGATKWEASDDFLYAIHVVPPGEG